MLISISTIPPLRRPARRRHALAATALAPVLAASLVALVGGSGPTVAERPRGLADLITLVPADGHSGPYTYLRAQSWTQQPNNTMGRVEVEHWQPPSRTPGPPLH